MTRKVSSTSVSGGPDAITGGNAGGLFMGVMADRPSLGAFSIETFLEEARRLFWLGWVQSSTSSM